MLTIDQSTSSPSSSKCYCIPFFMTRVVRAEETRYGGVVSKGDDGLLTMTKALDTDVEFASLVDNGRSRSTKLSVAETDDAAYSAAVPAATGSVFRARPAGARGCAALPAGYSPTRLRRVTSVGSQRSGQNTSPTIDRAAETCEKWIAVRSAKHTDCSTFWQPFVGRIRLPDVANRPIMGASQS